MKVYFNSSLVSAQVYGIESVESAVLNGGKPGELQSQYMALIMMQYRLTWRFCIICIFTGLHLIQGIGIGIIPTVLDIKMLDEVKSLKTMSLSICFELLCMWPRLPSFVQVKSQNHVIKHLFCYAMWWPRLPSVSPWKEVCWLANEVLNWLLLLKYGRIWCSGYFVIQ